MIHLSVPVLIGAGGINLHPNHSYYHFNDSIEPIVDNLRNDMDYNAFFVVEPGLNIELNLFKYVKLGFGASYRYIGETRIRETYVEDQLNGFSGNFSIMLGKF